jgi:hypothetical protein
MYFENYNKVFSNVKHYDLIIFKAWRPLRLLKITLKINGDTKEYNVVVNTHFCKF